MVKKRVKKQLIILILILYGISIIPIYFMIEQLRRPQFPFFLLFYGDDSPHHIHATWSSSNASENIAINWKTKKTSQNFLKWDTTSRGGNASLYSWENSSVIQNSNWILEGYFHSVTLTNLQPNTTYFFICGSDKAWSDEFKFKTPDVMPNEIIFAVGGDSRSQPEIRNAISNLMANYSPEFVIHTGDFIYDGNNQELWNIWFDGMQKYWLTNENYIIPIIPTIGNHENNAKKYYEQFSLPNNEQWYSVDYSSLLHVICLNSETNIDGEQLTWLENDLKQYNDTIWKIAFFHQPAYGSGAHEPRADIQGKWAPIFDKYNVSVVFQGHNHLYERSKPIKNNETTNSYLNGTMYITSGGWGAPLHSTNPQWFTNYTESEYHFCLINITKNPLNSTLVLKQIRLNNTIGDSISITKILS
ncbi:MAG: purple acid phosphatase family protein [Candidatus Helarchaeota archaeon]